MFAETNKIEKMKKLILILAMMLLTIAASAEKVRGWNIGSVPETTGIYLDADSATMLIVQSDYVAFNGKAYAVNYSKRVLLRNRYKFLLQDNEQVFHMYLRKSDKEGSRYLVIVVNPEIGTQNTYIFKR